MDATILVSGGDGNINLQAQYLSTQPARISREGLYPDISRCKPVRITPAIQGYYHADSFAGQDASVAVLQGYW
jgi:hypothetical protein